MKTCLILPCNLYLIPYFHVYESMFSEMKEEYDILTWNRSLIHEECNGTIFSYDKEDVANNRDPKKLLKYYGFYRFVKNHLKTHTYKRVVFLDTSACTVILMSSFMKRHYKHRYWIDVRDYSFENISVYRLLLKRAFDSAYLIDISSRGFLKFLPRPKNYCVTHNIDYETIEKSLKLPKIESPKIRISFIGSVRYYDLNKKLLNSFKNDERFIIQFFGAGSEELEKYCSENNIKNCRFEGRFPYERTAEFYQETDLINNIYGNSTMEVTTALSNKLYYSMYLNIPILVSPHTYMDKMVRKYNLGYTVDYSKNNLADELYNWYTDYIKGNTSGRKKAIKAVEKDFSDYKKKFTAFIKGEN